MKTVVLLIVMVMLLLSFKSGVAASARCVVIKKAGSTLLLECGERGKTFAEGMEVKMKSVKQGK